MNKFRDFSFRGKKRTQLKNNGLIEKKGNRIDTFGEKNQLSAAKVLKSRGYKSLIKNKSMGMLR